MRFQLLHNDRRTGAAMAAKPSIAARILKSRSVRIFLGCGAACVVTAFVAVFGLKQSFEVGRLSEAPWYDDVVYLYTAQVLLHAAPHQPWLHTLWQLVNQHAPLSTFLGALGFLAVPEGLSGPYIANTLVLGGFLIGCVFLLRPIPVAAAVGIIAAIGAIPLASLSITEFRPDFAWGFLSGLAGAALLRPRLFAFRWMMWLAIGALSGLALVSKPSAVPATAVLLAVAFGGSALLHMMSQTGEVIWIRLRAIMRAAALIGLGTALVAGPVYAVIWHDVYTYILLAMVKLHDQNTIPGDLLFHSLYYSTGDGGRVTLGRAIWVLLAFWTAALGYGLLLARHLVPRLLCYLSVILLAYAIPSLTVVKSLFFGSAFYGVLIASSAAVAGELWCRVLPRRRPDARIAIAGLTCATGVALLVNQNMLQSPTVLMTFSPEARKDSLEASDYIWSVLKSHALAREEGQQSRRVEQVMVLTPEPVTGGALSLYAATEGVPLRAYGFYYARSVDDLVSRLAEFDFVIATNSIRSQLFGPRLGDALLAVLNDRTDFKLIATYSRIVGGTVKVYEHIR
jgi:hypothetical protein